MKQPRHRLATLALSLQYAAVAASHPHHRGRQLRLIPEAERLVSRHEETVWHRELSNARRHVRDNGSRQLSSSSSSSSACTSPLQRWFIRSIQEIPANTWAVVEQYNITTLAYLYKHYVHASADGGDHDEYFGAYGERTNEMKGQHRGLVAFWTDDDGDGDDTGDDSTANNSHNSHDNVIGPNNSLSASAAASQQYLTTTTTNNNKQSNVLLLGMHGEDLSYTQTLVPTLQQIYSLEPSEATSLAAEIQTVIKQLPDGYANPLLTANAIATQSTSRSGGEGKERDSIIVGDGVFTFLEWLDLSSEGPSYIHSHEYAHHLQYDINEQSRGGTQTTTTEAERTRRLELMADVFGSYYAAHQHGGGYDAAKLYRVHRSAFSLGDCERKDGTHHGTPRQRECASNYGANLALPSYVDGGHRLDPVRLRDLFNKEYDGILSLDGSVCTPVVEESTLDKTIYGEDFERAEVPFYGDDGVSSSSSLNDDGLIGGDYTPSYLEPELSWFDPKPIDYYDGGSLSQEFGAEESSSSSSSVYEPYEPTSQVEETLPRQENNEWYAEDPSAGSDDWFGPTSVTENNNEWTTEDSTNAEDYLNAPPDTIGTDNSHDDADDWFAQTEWGEAYRVSSGVDVGPSRRLGGSMMIFACMTLLLL